MATSQGNRSQHFVAQLLQAPAKPIETFKRNRSQHCWAQHVARVWPPCSNTLRAENRTSAHAQAQHCWTNLAKRLQHHATSTNVAWKIWPFSNLSQQHPTCLNKSQQGGQTHATCCTRQCCDMLRWNVAIVWPGLCTRFETEAQGNSEMVILGECK